MEPKVDRLFAPAKTVLILSATFANHFCRTLVGRSIQVVNFSTKATDNICAPPPSLCNNKIALRLKRIQKTAPDFVRSQGRFVGYEFGMSDLAFTKRFRGMKTIRSSGPHPAVGGNFTLALSVMSMPITANPSASSQMSGQPWQPTDCAPLA